MPEHLQHPELPATVAIIFHRLFDYVAATDPDATVLATVLENEALRADAHFLMQQEGYDFEQAAHLVAGNGSEHHDAVLSRERAFAHLQYDGDLSATGLDLHPTIDKPVLRIARPAMFAAALSATELPAGPEARKLFHQGLAQLTHDNLQRIARAHIVQHLHRAIAMRSNEIPYWLLEEGGDLEDIAISRSLNEADHLIINSTSNYAVHIAKELDRLGVPLSSGADLRQFRTAVDEGLPVEWAVASDLRIIGQPFSEEPEALGEYEWSIVFSFLAHLREQAPQAHFTQQVKESLLARITAELERPFDSDAGEPITILEQTNTSPAERGIVWAEDLELPEAEPRIASPQEARAIREQLHNNLMQALRIRLQLIHSTLPDPSPDTTLPANATARAEGETAGDIYTEIALVNQALEEISGTLATVEKAIENIQERLQATLKGTTSTVAQQTISGLALALDRLLAAGQANASATEHLNNFIL